MGVAWQWACTYKNVTFTEGIPCMHEASSGLGRIEASCAYCMRSTASQNFIWEWPGDKAIATKHGTHTNTQLGLHTCSSQSADHMHVALCLSFCLCNGRVLRLTAYMQQQYCSYTELRII